MIEHAHFSMQLARNVTVTIQNSNALQISALITAQACKVLTSGDEAKFSLEYARMKASLKELTETLSFP